MTSQAERIINASVSKAFFVEMLVKDISLPMAIHDLIDNCIDGAKRLRGDESLNGLSVEVKVGSDEFSILDNCGGIDFETAENYAFRFGRPKDAPGVEHSIGRFGVGMKRAVFKLGRHFGVTSTTQDTRFEVQVDVAEWEQHDRWQFEFSERETFDSSVALQETGTLVRVTQLFPSVSEQFALDAFLNSLRASISIRYQTFLDQGLAIRINGRSVPSSSVKFLTSSLGLYPAFRQASYNGVVVRHLAGIGEPRPADAGWYIYCNGRLIVRADQSEITGWGEAGIDRIPKYHNYFARFRGCIYFDSDDPASLPWNTTKDGLDQESGVYRSVRTDMVTLMKPVIAFLRELAREQQEEAEGFRPLNGLLARASATPVSNLAQRETFHYVRPALKRRGPKTVRIQYDKPVDLVQRVQKQLNVGSARAAGESTFDYYVKLELGE